MQQHLRSCPPPPAPAPSLRYYYMGYYIHTCPKMRCALGRGMGQVHGRCARAEWYPLSVTQHGCCFCETVAWTGSWGRRVCAGKLSFRCMNGHCIGPSFCQAPRGMCDHSSNKLVLIRTMALPPAVFADDGTACPRHAVKRHHYCERYRMLYEGCGLAPAPFVAGPQVQG